MKRPSRKISVFLLLLVGGAIINIAVAWSIAISVIPTPPTTVPQLAEGEAAEVIERYGGQPSPRGAAGVKIANWGMTVRAANTRLMHTDLYDDRIISATETRIGWPVRTLVMAFRHRWRNGNTSWEMLHALSVPDSARSMTRGDWLPVRPSWPGFAINTAFFAGILWLLFAAPFSLRRRRRIKRGLCLKCAYPIGTNTVCTECGAAVPPSLPGRGK